MSKAPTLFDFDDFFSEEESKVKPVAIKNAVPQVSKEQALDPLAPEEGEAGRTEPSGVTERVVPQEPEVGTNESLKAPIDRIEDKYIKPRLELPGKQELSDALNQDSSGDLEQQFRQELAVSIPFVVSRYPFDPASVEVIEEKKPKQKLAPVLSPEAEHQEDPREEPMEPLPEWNLDKNYYTIGEVAHLFGVNISHIRFWTTEFKMKPRTTRKGDRLYTPNQIAQLRLIYHLVKEKKHTLKGALEILKSRKGSVVGHLDIRESLIQLRDMLAGIRDHL